jgi:hypothetical protein
MDKRRHFASFNEFYPFYLSEHTKPATRALHLVGLVVAATWLVICFSVLEPRYAWAALIFGYGFAWPAHFFIEKNRPATFQHPLYSFAGDFRMFYDVVRSGTLLFDQR